MKIKILLLNLIILSWTSLLCKENPKQACNDPSKATYFSNCVRPVAKIELIANNVRAQLSTDAVNFYAANYIFPNPDLGQIPVSAIYSSSLWMGGLDRPGNINLSAGNYPAFGSDYYSGPLDLRGVTSSETCQNWDRLFSVTGDVIKKHFSDFQSARNTGIPYDCNKIPDEIKYWPAQGNPYWQEKYNWQLPDEPLAPFWDENFDGIYTPCDGDFPIIDIENCNFGHTLDVINRVPTQHVFYVFNDNGGPQTLSGPTSIQMDIRVSSFAYSTQDELNNTTFHQYKMVNKRSDSLKSFYVGLFVDPDLGCYFDDFVGFDHESNMAYVYNQDSIDGIDEIGSCNGNSTYGNEIPMLGFSLLHSTRIFKRFKRDSNGQFILDQDGNKILEEPTIDNCRIDTLVTAKTGSFMYLENAAVGSPHTATTDPLRGREEGYYNFLKGIWSDGTPLTFGGTGYTPGSTDIVKFAFPDDPSTPGGWSMCNVTEMEGGDKKFLLSSEGYTLYPGQNLSFLYGIVGVLDVEHPCPDLSTLRFATDKASELFYNCFNITSHTEDLNQKDIFSDVYLYPNPASHTNNILHIANLPQNTTVRIMSLNGLTIQQFTDNSSLFLAPYQTVKSFEYSLVSLQSGIYVVHIMDNETGKSKSFQWIVL